MNPTNKLDNYFRELEDAHKFSGVALITRGERQIYSGAFGLASRAWGIPNALEMRYDTASITKLFTAVATLQMVDRGDFELETGVIDYLGLEDTVISKDVTPFHLLTHSSGIGDDAEEEDGEEYEDLWKTRPNYMVRETADFLPQFIHKPSNFPPGQGCRYCNCSYILLGLMIEKAAGISYRDYVRQNIFQPAGMTDSDFFHRDHAAPRLAEGADPIYDNDGELVGWKQNFYGFPPVGSPDAGAQVTAADLDRFIRAARAGDLLSPELTQAFFTPQVLHSQKDDWAMEYGYGLWFYVDESGEVVCCQKEGINTGISGMVRYFPKQDLNVVLLCTMMDAAWGPIWEIHRMIVDGLWD